MTRLEIYCIAKEWCKKYVTLNVAMAFLLVVLLVGAGLDIYLKKYALFMWEFLVGVWVFNYCYYRNTATKAISCLLESADATKAHNKALMEQIQSYQKYMEVMPVDFLYWVSDNFIKLPRDSATFLDKKDIEAPPLTPKQLFGRYKTKDVCESTSPDA